MLPEDAGLITTTSIILPRLLQLYFTHRIAEIGEPSLLALFIRCVFNKTPVIAAKDRLTGKVAVQVVDKTDKPTLTGLVEDHTADESTMVFTDEHPGYKGMINHVSIAHSRGQYVEGEVHTNGIEGFFGQFKRGIIGTYHHISPKHTERYAVEFAGRHNDRPRTR